MSSSQLTNIFQRGWNVWLIWFTLRNHIVHGWGSFRILLERLRKRNNWAVIYPVVRCEAVRSAKKMPCSSKSLTCFGWPCKGYLCECNIYIYIVDIIIYIYTYIYLGGKRHHLNLDPWWFQWTSLKVSPTSDQSAEKKATASPVLVDFWGPMSLGIILVRLLNRPLWIGDWPIWQ